LLEIALMSLTDDRRDDVVGHRRPPRHSRFQPGVSGNPSGRPKGTPNLKTMLEKVLKEQISLREGNETRKLTKAEAVIRSVVIGALKGDSRSQATLFRLAEQVGQFHEEDRGQTVEVVRFSWLPAEDPRLDADVSTMPAISKINRE
jgi:hypothetical protein